jgi:hypothetical protein
MRMNEPAFWMADDAFQDSCLAATKASLREFAPRHRCTVHCPFVLGIVRVATRHGLTYRILAVVCANGTSMRQRVCWWFYQTPPWPLSACMTRGE